jgi:hypothetical protein
MLSKLEKLDLLHASKPVRKGQYSLVEFDMDVSCNNGNTQKLVNYKWIF